MVSCHAEVMTLTEKLYYTSGETRTFTATVLSCTPEDGGYAVTLDRTALFPGGAGSDEAHISRSRARIRSSGRPLSLPERMMRTAAISFWRATT